MKSAPEERMLKKQSIHRAIGGILFGNDQGRRE
jgi:hypothetical protein